MDKEVFDLRGMQESILRLYRFDKGAFLHMLFYRIAVFVAIAAGLLIAADTVTLHHLAYYTKLLVALSWILFTPQLFAVFVAFSVMRSRGVAFGHLNSSFLSAEVEKRLSQNVYKALPYIAIAVWMAGFVMLIAGWLS